MAAPDLPELTELNTLIDTMNSLIITYLDLFDVYQPLQEKLCSHLSSGFFGISQANYASPGHRRYGMDYYDERMKALKGLDIEVLDGSHAKFKLKSLLEESITDSEIVPAASDGEEAGLRQRKKAQPRNSDHNDNLEESSEQLQAVKLDDDADASEGKRHKLNGAAENREEEEEEPVRRKLSERELRDPIRWFGVLVPQSLRAAQRDFSTALEEMMTISTLLKEMDWYEIKIKDLRPKIAAAKKVLAVKEKELEASAQDQDTSTEEN